MKKLLKYFKPYILAIIAIIVLIYIQVIGNLKLPDYMANIVNIGIQSNGVEDITPIAISENALEALKNFMGDKDKSIIEDSYELINSDSKSGDIEKYIEKYPLLKQSNIYVLSENILNSNEEKMGELNSIFKITDKTVIDILNKIKIPSANLENDKTDLSSINSTNLSFDKIYNAIPFLLNNMTPEMLEETIENAKNMEDTNLSQIALMFTKAFYSEIGMNIADIQTKYMFKVGAIMIAITLIIIITSILNALLSVKVSAGIAKNLRKDIFEKVQRFASKEFDKFGVSSLITRTTNDITQIQTVIFMFLRIVLFALLMMIGAILMINKTATTMLWVLILGFIVILVIIGVSLVITMPKFTIFQGLIDKLNRVSRECLSGIMVIRAFGTQKHEEKRFDKANYELANTMFFIDKVMALMTPLVTITMNLLILLIVWVGADKIASSTLQVGNMMAAIQYTMQVMISFLMITMMFVMFPRALVSIKRVLEILNTDITILDPEVAKNYDNNKIGVVEFKNVFFKYDNAEEYVLKDITFTAKPGETTAFIGSTGSGKTSLIKLIARFYDVNEGIVLVNGVNVKDVSQYELHKQIGYIPQKASLLSGTIESNLKYGNPDASKENIEKCVDVAQAKEFIESKEKQYEEYISQSGINISGGQKQRLSIARALVKNPPIYIFDDSFSALDFKTDFNLRQALKDKFKDVTKIIVAQRINTIMDAEQIIVLEEGKIVGKGSHQELMENCKTYKEIADSQLGGETNE